MRSRGRKFNRTLGICLMLLAASAVCRSLSAFPSGQEPTDTHPKSPAAIGIPSDTAACAGCHKEIVTNFGGSPHASQAELPHLSGMSCAECHGSGDAHIQSGGDKSKIFNLTSAPAEKLNGICLKCHAGKHVMFQHSAHGRSNVGCVRCHSIHAPHESKHLLTAPQPELCFQCHDEQRARFTAPSRHKVLEGLILCTDCHEPHGSFGEQLQRSPAQQDLICAKCHTEVVGPFEHEHAIIKTEGCSACHVPHGGPNSHMLNRASVNTICLLCHFPPPISSLGESLVHAHDLTAKRQSCIDCHVEIHGSNESAVFLKKK